jgi:hypothetical protein
MPDQFKDVDLSGYPFDVSHIDDLGLHQYLHCNFFASGNLGGQLHLSESALANGLSEQVVADPVLLLIRWLSHH